MQGVEATLKDGSRCIVECWRIFRANLAHQCLKVTAERCVRPFFLAARRETRFGFRLQEFVVERIDDLGVLFIRSFASDLKSVMHP